MKANKIISYDTEFMMMFEELKQILDAFLQYNFLFIFKMYQDYVKKLAK